MISDLKNFEKTIISMKLMITMILILSRAIHLIFREFEKIALVVNLEETTETRVRKIPIKLVRSYFLQNYSKQN